MSETETSNSPFVHHHIVRIAAALAPSPKDFRFVGIARGPGRCACGTPIGIRFILHNEITKREIVIGSTCIHATIPWLIRMDASDLADALKRGWSDFVAAERKAKTTADGEGRLRDLLPFAATLEMWAEGMLTRRIRSIVPLPTFWRHFVRGTLTAHDATTPGRRAAALVKRIRRFKDNVAGLKVLFAHYREPWTEPPECSTLPSEWYDMQMSAEELARLAKLCTVDERYYKLITIANRHQLTAIVNTPMPITVDELGAWMTNTRDVLERSDAFIDDSSRSMKLAGYEAFKKTAEDSFAATKPFRDHWPRIASALDTKIGRELHTMQEKLQLCGSRLINAKTNLVDLASWIAWSRQLLLSVPQGETLTATMNLLNNEIMAHARQQRSVS